MKRDEECVKFLQWCLPRMGLRWKGFRKVRRQVCRRISDRESELSITSLSDYRDYLLQNPSEWTHLRHCCRVTISRFYRDRAIFNALRWEVLPSLLKSHSHLKSLRVWSCGCASGEEVYTLRLIWEQLAPKESTLEIVATDTDPELLRRAEEGIYNESSLRELPGIWKNRYFEPREGRYRIRDSLRMPIAWLEQDVLNETPVGPFDLVMCRCLVFTYYDLSLQGKILSRIAQLLNPGGALILGQTEELPQSEAFAPWMGPLRIYRRLKNRP
jgi:chemotaxis protein methyltransferase CheR